MNVDVDRGAAFLGSAFGAAGSATKPSCNARLNVPVKLDPSALATVTSSPWSSSSSSASRASRSARSSAVSLGIGGLRGFDGRVGLVDDGKSLGDVGVWEDGPRGVDQGAEHVVDGFHSPVS